jgi:hypothetical protein
MPQLRKKYNVESIAIFGSYVRKENRENSDLDVLVTFREPPSLLRFISLEQHLSEMLGVKVDLVMRESLKPNIGKHILKEAVAI